MQCPEHKILMDYKVDALGFRCPWPDCKMVADDEAELKRQNQSIVPSVEQTWQKIQFDVTTFGDRVTIKATLPEGFSQREFTRIYHLRDALDFGMSSQEWIEYQKEQMFQDLIKRIKVPF